MRARTIRSSKAFTMAEVMTVLVVILVVFLMMGKIWEYYSYAILKTNATKLILNLEQCAKLAYTSNDGLVNIVFRPTDAPYTSYTISADGKNPQTFTLPGGVKIINTNGFIRNHILRVNKAGQFINEHNMPVFNPDPGLLTMTSDITDRILVLRINPKNGKIEIK